MLSALGVLNLFTAGGSGGLSGGCVLIMPAITFGFNSPPKLATRTSLTSFTWFVLIVVITKYIQGFVGIYPTFLQHSFLNKPNQLIRFG